MRRRRAKKYSEDLIREMLELYTMRPPFRIRKNKKKENSTTDSTEKDTEDFNKGTNPEK
jgi:hypothetical protein